jgi:hypothetical protein
MRVHRTHANHYTPDVVIVKFYELSFLYLTIRTSWCNGYRGFYELSFFYLAIKVDRTHANHYTTDVVIIR